MPCIFVTFRTFDRIWTCKTLTRQLAPFEMDMSGGPIKFLFTVDHIRALEGPDSSTTIYKSNTHIPSSCVQNATEQENMFYCLSHERLRPSIVYQDKDEYNLSSGQGVSRDLVRKFSLPNVDIDVKPQVQKTVAVGKDGHNATIYFVLPTYRCTLLLDAHVASCMQCEYSRSKTFRRRFMRFLLRNNAFRNCIPDYEKWSQKEREYWEHYLLVPYLIDIVAVWPKQKIDYAWSSHILGNLSKHISLEEGFAWLSTLGGAHSSLGETFLHHAERAGEISGHQLRLALQLGNDSLIARCYVFWSWSLLQRGFLKQSKTCILKTWKFCKSLKARDKILENMCKAVWSRLRYRRAFSRGKLMNDSAVNQLELRDDSSDSENDCDKIESRLLPSPVKENASVKSFNKEERSGACDNSSPVGKSFGNGVFSVWKGEQGTGGSSLLSLSKECTRLKPLGSPVKVC
ncbi:hypothetical protein PoB_002591800 [Plakobranchus ocellatus]|uniref:Uncharacterized protein n=1 Tax=Plakobranchus ocellatus TaxID=259542 RepID=A0AAV3ZYD9_9GAST|nr:hypothetical protein PoB_002591800 [Plakobranchus ocellatus]